MSRDSSSGNWRTIGVAVVAGGVLILVAAQLLAKPGGTPAARRCAPAGGAARAESPAPPPLRVAAEPVVRDLFRPLVGKPEPKKETAATAPSLPPAGPAPVERPAGPVAPPAPAGPRASTIQMLGVIEMGDEVKALLRNSETGESRYFGKGEEVFGFKLEEIKADEVKLAFQDRRERVVMSNLITIEGPGAGSAAGASGFGRGGGGRTQGGGFGRGGATPGGGVTPGPGAGGGAGTPGGGFSTTAIMSLPTWAERLKKLEEIKPQMEAAQYERLHRYISERAKREAEEKK
jgi:hypothetical protein